MNKELLEEVLGYNIDYIASSGETYIGFHTELGGEQINIYELSFKCKQYALKRGYILDFKVAITKKFMFHLKDTNNENFPVGTMVEFDGDSEESYFIDSEGLVYLYLSKPSKYNLKVLPREGKSCNTTFNISQTQIDSADMSAIDLVCR